ncbi:MAG: hypothetical protein LBK67_11665 [Coriobacteriales bacterium]|jgi:hypothetical protein|nr:hypothetical protein [Coriobacteriales bacterium]
MRVKVQPTCIGKWQLPHSEQEVDGTLLVDEEKKSIILRIVMSSKINNSMPKAQSFSFTERITGKLTDGHSILLVGCRLLQHYTHTALCSHVTMTISARYAFYGLNLESEDLLLNGVDIDFGEIISWTNLCEYISEYDGEKERFQWKSKDPVSATLSPNAIVTFTPTCSYSTSGRESLRYVLEQSVICNIKYHIAMSFKTVLDDIRKIQYLISFGMGERVDVNSIEYYHASHYDETLDRIRPGSVLLGIGLPEEREHTVPYEYFFTLSDITQNDSISMWFADYEKLEPVVDLYQSGLYNSSITSVMMFLNLTQAIETYHSRFVADNLEEYTRIVEDLIARFTQTQDGAETDLIRESLLPTSAQGGHKHIVLKSRLGYVFLSPDIDYTFYTLDSNSLDFINKVVASRNYYTHYDEGKRHEAFSKSELPYVNGVLMTVLSYHLLNKLKVPKKRIAEQLNMKEQRVGDLFNEWRQNPSAQ